MSIIKTTSYIIGNRIQYYKEYKAAKRFNLKKFYKKHEGEVCFIVATGPSLKLDDLEKIHEKGTVCFSVNSCVKLFDKTRWRPTYYTVSDVDVWNAIEEMIKSSDLNCVFTPFKIPFKHSNGYKFRLNTLRTELRKTKLNKLVKIYPEISDDISKYVSDGNTVIFIALQIAAYMGFKKIYLLGTDCNYEIPHSSLTDYTIKRTTAVENIGNEMLLDYKIFGDYAEKNNIEVFNLTRGGMLEIFPRINFDDLY